MELALLFVGMLAIRISSPLLYHGSCVYILYSVVAIEVYSNFCAMLLDCEWWVVNASYVRRRLLSFWGFMLCFYSIYCKSCVEGTEG